MWAQLSSVRIGCERMSQNKKDDQYMYVSFNNHSSMPFLKLLVCLTLGELFAGANSLFLYFSIFGRLR